VARRYLQAAIAPGTALAPAARLSMRGSIKLGRWLPFRARQLLVPSLGTVWVARVAGVISGSDRYVDGVGGMDWKVLGVLRVMHAGGDDVSRSAAERAAGESIWVPTALAVDASLTDDGTDRVRVDVDGHHVTVLHELDADGLLTASWFQRWGDSDNTGTWTTYPFGVEVIENRSAGASWGRCRQCRSRRERRHLSATEPATEALIEPVAAPRGLRARGRTRKRA
jgi:hypothetical protein